MPNRVQALRKKKLEKKNEKTITPKYKCEKICVAINMAVFRIGQPATAD